MKHEIIYTESNAFILTDVFENQTHCWHVKKQEILEVKGVGESSGEIHHEKGWNKPGEVLFIAAHRPLNDIPTLEGVPLLPDWNVSDEELLVPFPNSTQTRRLRDGSEIKTWMLGWEEGFKEAKETYEYTLSDLRRAFTTGRDLIVEKRDKFGEWEVFTKFIDSLQQLKRPKYFEMSYDTREVGNHLGGVSIESIEETITNSQGQTQLVGEYIYETNS